MTTTSTTPSLPSAVVADAAPLETVQRLYSAFGAGDMPGLFALLDPEIDWSIQVDAPGAELVPMLRHGRGHAAAMHYFTGAAELEFHIFEPHTFHVAGEVVLVELRLDLSHRQTGKRAELEEIHHWTVRDGKAVRYRPFVDTATLIELFRP